MSEDVRVIDDEEAYYRKVREDSTRDRSRNLDRRKMVDWQPSPIVDEWPCRNKACRQPCDVTQEGERVFVMFNKMLEARGEEPMRTDEVMVCDACRKLVAERAVESATRKAHQIRARVLEYRGDAEPTEMRKAELERELEQLGHPDVKGFVDAVKRRREGKGRKARTEDRP